MEKHWYGISTAALCACSLSALGMTEMIPQFGKLSSWAVTRDKPTDEQHLTMTAWFKVTAVKAKGRYPLISFTNAPSTIDIAELTAASSAWTTRADGSHRDAAERVKLGWDAEAKTIYADVTQAPGMALLVR